LFAGLGSAAPEKEVPKLETEQKVQEQEAAQKVQERAAERREKTDQEESREVTSTVLGSTEPAGTCGVIEGDPYCGSRDRRSLVRTIRNERIQPQGLLFFLPPNAAQDWREARSLLR
jgi:hypothetical protein